MIFFWGIVHLVILVGKKARICSEKSLHPFHITGVEEKVGLTREILHEYPKKSQKHRISK